MFVLYEYKEKIKSKGKKNIVFFGSIACYFVYFCCTNMKIPNQVKAEWTQHTFQAHISAVLFLNESLFQNKSIDWIIWWFT